MWIRIRVMGTSWIQMEDTDPDRGYGYGFAKKNIMKVTKYKQTKCNKNQLNFNTVHFFGSDQFFTSWIWIRMETNAEESGSHYNVCGSISLIFGSSTGTYR